MAIASPVLALLRLTLLGGLFAGALLVNGRLYGAVGVSGAKSIDRLTTAPRTLIDAPEGHEAYWYALTRAALAVSRAPSAREGDEHYWYGRTRAAARSETTHAGHRNNKSAN